MLGELITRPEPLRLEDVGSHPRSYGFPSGHPPMRSFLGVPVFVRGEPFGNLYLAERTNGAPFSDADEQALVMLAGLAGVAIDHAGDTRRSRSSARNCSAPSRRSTQPSDRPRRRRRDQPRRDPAAGRQTRQGAGLGACPGDRVRTWRRDAGRRGRRRDTGRADRTERRPPRQPCQLGAADDEHAAAGNGAQPGLGSPTTGLVAWGSTRRPVWWSR